MAECAWVGASVQVGVTPGVFISRILLSPKVFYQCLPSLRFFAAPFSRGVVGGPLSRWKTILVPLCSSICLVVLSRQLAVCFKCSFWILVWDTEKMGGGY